MIVVFVLVSSRGVGLPDFHERASHGISIVIQNCPADDDAFAEWLSGVLLR